MFVKNSNLHIRRFEFKYLVREEDLDKIRRSISNFVINDPYVTKTKNGIYQVNSIYFDDTNNFTYFEKLAGVKKRKKFRIRTYDTNVNRDSKVFLEIKRRDDVVIFKDRSQVPYTSILKALEKGEYENLANYGEKEVSRDFLFYYLKHSLRPNVLISYKREAYLDSKNYSFRITLDQDLMAARRREINFDKDGLSVISPGFAVVEAKFNRIMPAWFGQVIKAHDLTRMSFSKYCFGIEACGILPKTDLSQLPYRWIY